MDESSSMGQWLLFGVDKLQGTAYNKKRRNSLAFWLCCYKKQQ
ncbi:MAG: hypothetical protein ACLRT5_16090 [Lachnospiraceae bacterium]